MSPRPDTTLPDEDTFVVPRAWRRHVLPRRGGVVGSNVSVEQADSDVGKLFAPLLADLNRMLDHPSSDPELASEARGALCDPDSATVLGAAVLATAASYLVDKSAVADLCREAADRWLARRGVVFAARFAVELADEVVMRRDRGRGGASRYLSGDRREIWDLEVYIDRFEGLWSAPNRGVSEVPQLCWSSVLRRVRTQLVAVTDEQYAQVRAALEQDRDRGFSYRVASSFLLPTEVAWVDDDCRAVALAMDRKRRLLAGAVTLWCAVTSVAQARELTSPLKPWWWWVDSDLYLMTAAAELGPSAAPLLAEAFDIAEAAYRVQPRLLSVLPALPSDEAFRLLVARLDRPLVWATVLEARKRFPVRAVRVLAEVADESSAVGRAAAEILRAQVRAYPAAVAAALPMLTGEVRDRVGAVVEAVAAVPTAPAEVLPAVLVSSPRAVSRRVAAEVVSGLAAPVEVTVVWVPGERESWLAMGTERWQVGTDQPWEEMAAEVEAGRVPSYGDIMSFFLFAPDALARPLVRRWLPEDRLWDVEPWYALVARFGEDVVPAALRVVRQDYKNAVGFLAPVASAEVALVMADWLASRPHRRSNALAWLRRHPVVAARGLVPVAVGEPGRQRLAAEQALRVVAATGEVDVLAVAKEYGAAAAAVVETLLAGDALAVSSGKVPVLPEWADPGFLPPVLLRDRSAVLPLTALRHLCTMLAVSTLDEPHPGVRDAVAVCDPASLAEFGWALLERWQTYGDPHNGRWVFTALRWLAGPDLADRIVPMIRVWVDKECYPVMTAGLELLAGIGSDEALRHLYALQKGRFPSLRNLAKKKVAEVAAARGLTPDQLADRLVPTLGLDQHGSLPLDYGPRRFTVRLDDQLRPGVFDESGKALKSLPKPGPHDDGQLAPAAMERFATFKKEVRALAAERIGRLERAMVTQRLWTVAEFRALFLTHPVMWKVVRRLVWACFAPDGQVRTALRVAEDRTFADVGDAQVTLGDDELVGVVHPVQLGETLPAWSRLFADYEILQPFPQLGRPVYRLSGVERKASTLDLFGSVVISEKSRLALLKRGWARDKIEGVTEPDREPSYFRSSPGGMAVVASVQWDLNSAVGTGSLDQRLTAVWVNDRPAGGPEPRDVCKFGDIDPVTVSEAVRDLMEVTE